MLLVSEFRLVEENAVEVFHQWFSLDLFFLDGKFQVLTIRREYLCFSAIHQEISSFSLIQVSSFFSYCRVIRTSELSFPCGLIYKNFYKLRTQISNLFLCIRSDGFQYEYKVYVYVYIKLSNLTL